MADKQTDVDGLIESLTEREGEILNLGTKGLSTREMPARLYLSYKTVKGYNTQMVFSPKAGGIQKVNNLFCCAFIRLH